MVAFVAHRLLVPFLSPSPSVFRSSAEKQAQEPGFDVNTIYIYNGAVRFEWDEAKRAANIARHGIDFVDAQEIFAGPMLVSSDTRRDYGEARQIGFGFIRERLMAVVFTEREPDTIRIISVRKANQREKAYFQEAIAHELGKN